MEMLLVLSILVLAFTIAFPALNRLYLEHELKEAAQLVQSRLSMARVHALDEGVPYQFLFELNGPRFLVIPEEPDGQAMAGTTGTGAMTSVVQQRWKMAGQVEEGIVFETSPTTLGTEHVAREWLTGLPDPDKLADAAWGTPISFYPDGTSTGGIVQVSDTHQRLIQVSVRSLTGGVTVAPIEQKGRL
jgi:Tfp pilus assembly protein FimT